jgi:hypothetical protein
MDRLLLCSGCRLWIVLTDVASASDCCPRGHGSHDPRVGEFLGAAVMIVRRKNKLSEA